MADRSEENGLGDEEGKKREERLASGKSRGSAESKKSVHDAVSKMTVKALKEFRLSEPSEVDTVVTGGESEGLLPGETFTQEIPAFDPQGVPGAQTLLSEDITGQDGREDDLRGDVGGEEEDLSDEESGSEGETDMVVLDPDHPLMVRFQVAYKSHLLKQQEKVNLELRELDLLVDRLTQTVDRLREEIDMFETQCVAQLDETKAAQKALSEATTEIEALQLERKQLAQQWYGSLIGMRRRDEAYAAMQEALNLQRQRIQAIETEIEGYRKSISKAQEQNEQITLMHNKIEADISMVKKLMALSKNKQEVLKTEYSKYTRTLHETEQQLSRAETEVTLKDNELATLRKQIEREFLEKIKVEDNIMEKMRSQLTLDKAAQYTKKVTDKLRRRATELVEAEGESITMQNQIDALNEEKERLLNSLVEAERQIMLWEKKTQLAREAKNAVDFEYGQGEIKAMKAEIHRMQVRYSQLMRQQEKMIQDMEKSVVRREVIITRYIQVLREKQMAVSHDLEEKQTTCQQLQSTADELEVQIDKLSEERHMNLADIVAKQQKLKYYTLLKNGKYTPLCKTPESLANELQKQRDRLQSLMTIVDRLNQEFPQAQPALRKITLSLGYRGMPEEAAA
ncbi:PREDICTED: coiled-coil domain-containing protein 40-like [Acropora digitifera]|uniref:coiled-coil domain-containing protein 40-like n=1 Tax=Acropora digitifera TaxID=70779 RepID=UPI00077AE58E|nr:PREDICTED: coiled-coil domain-containing protein 40-like [Acropora digitifera]